MNQSRVDLFRPSTGPSAHAATLYMFKCPSEPQPSDPDEPRPLSGYVCSPEIESPQHRVTWRTILCNNVVVFGPKHTHACSSLPINFIIPLFPACLMAPTRSPFAESPAPPIISYHASCHGIIAPQSWPDLGMHEFVESPLPSCGLKFLTPRLFLSGDKSLLFCGPFAC